MSDLKKIETIPEKRGRGRPKKNIIEEAKEAKKLNECLNAFETLSKKYQKKAIKKMFEELF